MDKQLLKEIKSDPKKYAEEAKISDLVNVLKELSDAYYNTGNSLVPDEIFDIMKDILQKRSPKNKFLKEVGAPIKKGKVTLPFPMMSLEKIKNSEALEKWLKKYDGEYVVSDKLDGISAMICNQDSLKMYTRGDGKEGQDITHLLKYVVEKKVLEKMDKSTCVRGELIMTRKDFEEFSNNFENARNAVGGQVNSKHPNMDVIKKTKFVAYSVVDPRYKQEKQMELLKKYGFNVTYNKTYKTLSEKILKEILDKRRNGSEYEIDGMVVIDNSQVYDLDDSNPDYGFAFKSVREDQVKEVIVEDVIWEASKDAYIYPTIKIKPTKVSGVTITNVTAHNAKYIDDNKLGPGAVIKIVRSGDVIPYILEVVKPAKKAKMPDTPYKWDKNGTHVIVKDIFDEQSSIINTVKVKSMEHFFSKLDVKFISEGILTKLVGAGFDTIFKILKADKKKLTQIEGIGNKLVDKIFENIDNAFKTTSLPQLMAASNLFGRGLGERKLKLITDTYPSIMEEKWKTSELTEKINSIKGFDTITTEKFVEYLPEFKKFFTELGKIYDISHLKKAIVEKKTGNLFDGMTVVFTGFRNKDYEKFITDNGGKVSTSVSGNTKLVVHSKDTTGSSKLEKAKELKIKIMTDDEFKKQYKL